MAHAYALRALKLFTFRLQRGGKHYFGLLEFLQRLVTARRHGRTQRAKEIETPVVFVGPAEQHFLECVSNLRARPCASRQRRVECRHAPMETSRRRLEGAGEGRTNH